MNAAGPELTGEQIGILIAVGGVALLVALLVSGLLTYFFLYKPAMTIPEQHRQMVPWHAFLLMIPLFNFVWLFIFPKNLSRSFQSWLGTSTSDDCGEKIGLYWAICAVASVVPIPCINSIVGIGSLVLWILYLVKVNECKNRGLAIGDTGEGFAPIGAGGGDPANPFST